MEKILIDVLSTPSIIKQIKHSYYKGFVNKKLKMRLQKDPNRVKAIRDSLKHKSPEKNKD